MVRRLFFGLTLAGLILSGCGTGLIPHHARMDLNGRWEFCMAGDSVWYEATVPGTVHTDLYKNVLIDDPFYRDNEAKLQWIDTCDWVYRKRIQPDPALFLHDSIRLIFSGLDTFAEIWLNGERVAETNNMFRSWTLNVTHLLRKGEENEIRVIFSSPIKQVKTIYDQQPYPLPAANDRAAEKLSVYARKAPYHFGWDWGPRFVTSGIWQPVSLEGWSHLRLQHVYFRQKQITDKQAHVVFHATVQSHKKQRARLRIRDQAGGKLWLDERLMLEKGENEISHDLFIPDPERWWPNGLGEAHLYTVTTEIRARGGLAQNKTRLGLREVELVREPDATGESFFFRINGKPVFVKGANYIPQDHFVNHVVPSEYEHLIRSARDAHMNMLRVWGGGIYEQNFFYDLCDQYGIMVWQDFMFACSMYPGDQAFMDNVEAEARQQVIRLRNHPSVVLWCGNNEVQDAWHRWGWKARYKPDQQNAISEAYQQLFHELLPSVTRELDPERAYWPSSPASGPAYGDLSVPEKGDYHDWDVWHGRQPFESYADPVPRFSSEFGFQAFPDIRTVYSYTLPADRNLDSPVMQAHQKHPVGNELIRSYMEQYLPVPEDFEGMIYMSQVLQGEGIRWGIEALRRSQPKCMGALYWQLNDSWPVASWSGIDYFGRWKALHYQVSRAYAPVLLSFAESDDHLELYLISDLQPPLTGRLNLLLADFSGRLVWEDSLQVHAAPQTAEQIVRMNLADLFTTPGMRKEVFLQAIFTYEHGDTVEALHYFDRAKNLSLQHPTVSIRQDPEHPEKGLLVESPVLVRQLFIRYTGEAEVRLEPNYFDLLPGQARRVIMHHADQEKVHPELFEWMSVNRYINREQTKT